MHVQLTAEDEMASAIRNRAHYIVVFGRGATFAIDEVDAALGVYPTFPTAMCPSRFGMFLMTVVPKQKVSRKRMLKALSTALGRDVDAAPDQDIFVVSEGDDYPAIQAWMAELVGDSRPC